MAARSAAERTEQQAPGEGLTGGAENASPGAVEAGADVTVPDSEGPDPQSAESPTTPEPGEPAADHPAAAQGSGGQPMKGILGKKRAFADEDASPPDQRPVTEIVNKSDDFDLFDDEDDGDFIDELKPGTKLLHGQYVITQFLNSGGFGITYLAKDSLDRTVVIKECFPGTFCRRSATIVRARSRAHQGEFRSVVRLFIQEARSLAKLNHPNIVGVHQVFEDNDTAYMAIDFIDGADMLDLLQKEGKKFSPEEIVTYLRKLLGAVGFIHKGGLLHRDISPDNILVNQQNEPILIDFGAAREQASKNSRALSALRVVKDGYSPQEFYVGGTTQGPFSDLYALGASFYHLITGDPPPDSQRRLAAVAEGSNDPYKALAGRFDGYPPGFLEAIDKALAILPRERLQSADEWLAAFDRPEPEPVAETRRARPVEPAPPAAEEPVEEHLPDEDYDDADYPAADPGQSAYPTPRHRAKHGPRKAGAVPGPGAGPPPAPSPVQSARGPQRPARPEVPSGPAPKPAEIEAAVNDLLKFVSDEPAPQPQPKATPAPEPRPAPKVAEPPPKAAAPKPLWDEDDSDDSEEVWEKPAPAAPAPRAPAPQLAPNYAERIAMARALEDEESLPRQGGNSLIGMGIALVLTVMVLGGGYAFLGGKGASSHQPEDVQTDPVAASGPVTPPNGEILPGEDVVTVATPPVRSGRIARDQLVDARWVAEIPFATEVDTGSSQPFPKITSVSRSADAGARQDWMYAGVKIFAINDVWVANQAAIEAAIGHAEASPDGTLRLRLRVRKSENAPFDYENLRLSSDRRIVLRNGLVFGGEHVGNWVWRTTLNTLPEGYEGELEEGDVLVSEQTTGTRIEGAKSLETTLQGLVSRGATEAVFVVKRGRNNVEARMALARE